MSVDFYRKDDVLWIKATSGGHGGGQTSVYEAPAKDSDIEQHPREHGAFLALERAEAAASAASTWTGELPQDASPLSLVQAASDASLTERD